jgi:hypothetical protein
MKHDGSSKEADNSSETSSLGSSSVQEDTDNLLSDVELQSMGEDKDESPVTTPSLYFNRRPLGYKCRKLLLHGSFYVVGLSILVAGGISSHFHPHVDPEEYANCTDFGNSSYLMDDVTL